MSEIFATTSEITTPPSADTGGCSACQSRDRDIAPESRVVGYLLAMVDDRFFLNPKQALHYNDL